MTDKQPRGPDGRFISFEELEREGRVSFIISEYECRVIGNRLRRLGERYKTIHSKLDVQPRVDQDCFKWSKKFLDKCATRDKFDKDCYENGEKRHTRANYNVKIELTSYECWSLGNRLFEIGEWFQEKGHEKVGRESKWLGRRFHAEQKQQNE